MNTNICIPENRLAVFCKVNGITRLALFGSVLRDDFGPDSDVDVLVEFEPERIPGLLGVAAMEIALSDLFGGRKVDLRTPEDLSRYFRQEVLDAAEVRFADVVRIGTTARSPVSLQTGVLITGKGAVEPQLDHTEALRAGRFVTAPPAPDRR